MRTRNERAMLLAEALHKWCGMAANYNAMIVLLNQLRDKPGVMYGDPTGTPGGRAMRHCCSIRAGVRRFSNGHIRKGGRIIGITGAIKNKKNKAGAGSVAEEECGFRILWNRPHAKIEFMGAKEAEAQYKGERKEQENG
jgi:RecA/RadA recombinase